MDTVADRSGPPVGIGRVVTAMISPFDADGELDLAGAQRLAEHLVATGTDTVLVNGTTGESPTLHGEEPWRLLTAVKEAVGGSANVMMGTGSNSTATTIANTERATEQGADAVLVVTPYYNRPDQRGLIAHFTAAAAATDLPLVVYDIPGRTACEIAVDTLVELSGVDNIVGVKDATGNVGKAAEVLHATTTGVTAGLAYWSGADELNLPLLAVGAVGVVSVSAHLVGRELAEMIEVFPSDPVRARVLHLRCMPLHRALFKEPSPAPLKGALTALGLPAGGVRAPLAAASTEVVEDLLAALRTIEAAR